MALKCDQCGAPLSPQPGDTVVQCTYCNATHEVGAAANRGGAASSAPAGADNPKKSPIVMIALSLILAIGAGVAVFATKGTDEEGAKESDQSGQPGQPAPDERRRSSPPRVVDRSPISLPAAGPKTAGGGVTVWRSHESCTVDANGDGVDDVAGLLGPAGKDLKPTLVDGKTGSLIWQGAAQSRKAHLYCLSEQWFVIAQPDFRLDFYKARKPQVPTRVAASDQLDGLAMGAGCARYRTQDRKLSDVSLPGGVATKCKTRKLHRVRGNRPGVLGLTGRQLQRTVKGTTYTLKKKRSGTPMLSVEVRRQGKTLWAKQLDVASPTFGTGLAVAGKTLLIWGAKPANRQVAWLVALDSESGKQRYERSLKSRLSNQLSYLHWNGKVLMVAYWTGLHGFEPTAGKRIWTVGR